jgi:bacterial leucyl aminopeptidase
MRVQLAMLMAMSIAACAEAPMGSPSEPPIVESERRWITIDGDAVETAREALAERLHGATLDVLEIANDVAIVEFDEQDFLALSQLMHEKHNRCGGFVLHDSLEEARTATRSRELQSLAPLVTYTIDNGPTVQALLPLLSESTILTTIQNLSALTTRYYTSATGGQASTQLRDLWLSYAAGRPGVTVELFETGFTQKSVIATIPGSTLATEVVVVGGHLDSISPGSPGSRAPGADDDASGIATLTEVFRVLMAADFRPRRTVKFMAYAAEEVGLVGSQQIVSSFQANAINVVGVMQFDMTNYKGSTQDIYLMQDFTNAAQNTFVGNLIDTYTGATRGTDSCGYGCSDHARWHNAGYAASMPFEARMTQYNPNIHTVNDTLAVSGNSAAQAFKFSKLGVAYVGELAKGQLGPSNDMPPTVSITAPTNGQMFPQGTPVQLTGTASDAEDGPLSSSIRWSSNLGGQLGTGASISVTLAVGSHTIQASVTDSGGQTTSTSVAITVTGTAPSELFRDTFEGATNWSPTGLWHLANNSTCASPGYSSATHAMYFGRDAQCNYATGARVTGTIISPVISGVVTGSRLQFKFFRRVESAAGGYDASTVEVVTGATSTTVWSRSSTTPSNSVWNDSGSISLSSFAGQAIQLRFKFDSRDSVANNFTGWLIDDVVVTR